MKKIFSALSIVFVIFAFGVVANAQTFENKEVGIAFSVSDNYDVSYESVDTGIAEVYVTIEPGRVGFNIASIETADAYFDGLIEDYVFESFLESMVATEDLSKRLEGNGDTTFLKKDVYTTYIGDTRFFVYDGTYMTSGTDVITETLYLTTYAWAKNGRIYYMEYYRFSGEEDNFRPEEFLGNLDYEPGTIKIVMNGKRIYPDTSPAAVEERILVPIRAVAEEMGYEVRWDAENSLIGLMPHTEGKNEVVFGLGYTDYLINGETAQLDVPAIAFNGRTYIPLRAAAESMGATVYWDGNTNTAYINY